MPTSLDGRAHADHSAFHAISDSAEAHTSRLVDLIREVVFEIDTDGNWAFLNPAWHRLTRFSVAETEGQPVVDWLHPSLHEAYTRNFFDLLEGNLDVLRGEVLVRTKDSDYRWMEVIAEVAGATSQGERRVVGTLVDIHDLKQSADVLKHAQETAEEANRAKSEFLAIISREMRAPLGALVGMSKVLGNAKLTAQERETVLSVRRSAQELLSVLNSLIDLSRFEAGLMKFSPVPVDIRLATEDVIESFALEADRKGLDLAFCFDQDLPKRLMTDPGRYRQLLSILVDNAIRYTQKGQIVITLGADCLNENDIAFRVCVKDTGSGLLPEGALSHGHTSLDLSKITHGKKLSFGLELARHLITFLRGASQVESAPGKGTTIALRLLCARETQEWPAPIPPNSVSDSNLLVVDPSPIIHAALDSMLAGGRCQITHVHEANTALAIVRNRSLSALPFDAVLYSLESVGLDWEEFVARLRKVPNSSIPVVILSRSTSMPGGAELARVGCGHLLRRNPTRQQLWTALSEALENSRVKREERRSKIASQTGLQDTLPQREAKKRILLISPPETDIAAILTTIQQSGCEYAVERDYTAALALGVRAAFDLVLLDQAIACSELSQFVRDLRTGLRSRLALIVRSAEALPPVTGLDFDQILPRDFSKQDLQTLLSDRDLPPAFDFDVALSRCGGDLGLLAELSAQFRETASSLAVTLLKATAVRDSVVAGECLDKIKTAARFFGASTLCDYMDQVTELVNLQDWASLPRRLSSARLELNRLCSDLPAFPAPDTTASRSTDLAFAPNSESNGTILAIDGDFLSRAFIQRVLMRAGYSVLIAATPADAKTLARTCGYRSLSCVLTDFSLPQDAGADLLSWISQEDPSIASVATSGSPDKALVEQSLRSGACNFLNKPFDRATLEQAVAEAAKLTRRQRRTLQIQRDVEQVGAVQRLLIRSSITGDASEIDLCHHPKHEAGGDFFAHLNLPDGRSIALLTDVSGHELKSAFVSAYFQGMVRTMLELGLALDVIFERGNTFLLNESASAEKSIPVSIAVCAVCIDSRAGNIDIFNSGAPRPVFIGSNGECAPFQTSGSYPLGWFPEIQVDYESFSAVSGQVILWTDGVEELAEHFGVSPASVASALALARDSGATPTWLKKANDDILVATWKLNPLHLASGSNVHYLPILNERYKPERAADIDIIQNYLVASLRFTVPDVSSELLHDIALCAREALLNALRHGCVEGGEATLQLTFAPAINTFTLVVEDEGPGHDFDCDEHAAIATTQLTPKHRGLILMRALSSHFQSDRNGAKLTMDFAAQEPQNATL